jgi:hypothetical protein
MNEKITQKGGRCSDVLSLRTKRPKHLCPLPTAKVTKKS